MDYYSRTDRLGHKEILEEHLTKVGNLCSKYTNEFNCPNLGLYLGYVHDIGKRTQRFQDVLLGKENKINHTVASYLKIISDFKFFKNIDDNTKKFLEEFTYICVSHHYGISSEWNLDEFIKIFLMKSDYEYTFFETDKKKISISSLEERKDVLDFADNFIDKDLFIKAFEEYLSLRNKCKDSLESMLLLRFIFSSLVDADYTASESFSNPNILLKSDSNLYGAEDEFLEKLIIYQKDLVSKSIRTPMNNLRSKVFSNCLDAGKEDYTFTKLNAPTGVGKTLSLMAYALSYASNHKNSVSRIIVIEPFLSIINQNIAIYQKIFGKENILEDDSNVIFDFSLEDIVDKKFIDTWNCKFVVTSSVKFFEMLFSKKGTDLRKLHYLTNAIVIFDEAQTLPYDLIDSSILSLNYLSRAFYTKILFSTATMPNYNSRKKLKNIEFFDIFEDSKSLFDEYSRLKKVSVYWRIDKPLTDKDIISYEEKYTSSLTIFNKIKFAQNHFKYLVEKFGEGECFCLTTMMCKKHRDRIISEIKFRLDNGLPCHVVSTQCIEAGVDLDFDFVARQLAPAESVSQAEGRCDRNATKGGVMLIFCFDENKPYPDEVYAKCSEEFRLINNEFNKKFSRNFDLNSLDDINTYFSKIFALKKVNEDKKVLIDAINNFSFEDVCDNYKLIENSGFKIIVPYSQQLDLYDKCLEILRDNNTDKLILDKKIFSLSSGICINSFVKESELMKICTPIYMKSLLGECIPCGWFLLDKSNSSYYSEDIGFSLDNILDNFLIF